MAKKLQIVDKASIVRFVALIGSLLAYVGIKVPESTIELVSTLIVTVIALYAAFKNNYLFEKGKRQKEELEPKGLK